MEKRDDNLLDLPENKGFKKLVESIKQGRPRKFDRDEYAIKLATWALKDDSLNLNGFCGEEGIPATYLHVWARDNQNFSLAYEATKAKLARRREVALKEGNLHVKAYDLNARVYDKELYGQWKDEKNFELRAKKEIDKEDLSKVDGRLLELLSALKEKKDEEI
jgi:hypothetical protein